ncbi:MAG: CRISPR-associated endonuclease Cas2 [Candidatus Daviesbacteria bacterium]|nr:CRISPR-associated endonuclease Cas2 [Candidatus Daviesbacteria bacterium]
MNEEKVTTKDVLKIIAVSGIVAASMIIPTVPMAAGAVYKAWKNFNKKDIGRIIKRLEKQEMISYQEKDGKIIFEITEKGKHRLLEYDFENLDIKKKKLDGKWRLVIFDIPEDKKVSRDAFRKKLLQMEFIRLQDSVFATCYPCKKEIDFLVHYFGISDFITLIKVDQIERGEKLIFKKILMDD